MNSITCSDTHRINHNAGVKQLRRSQQTRMLLGARFKILLADTGLSVDGAAKLLHVTPRTILYWISGKVRVPYAAYKLVRVMRLFELPCDGWDGCHRHSGKLWNPEGRRFEPLGSNWWNPIVRRPVRPVTGNQRATRLRT